MPLSPSRAPERNTTAEPARWPGRIRRAAGAALFGGLLVTCVSDERLAPRPSVLTGAVVLVELLQNGDFEAGGAGWQNSDSAGRSLDAIRVHAGLYAQRIQAAGLTDYAVYQDLPANPGGVYDAAGWVATDSLAGTGASLELLWLDTLGLPDTIPPAHLLGTAAVGTATGSQDWLASPPRSRHPRERSESGSSCGWPWSRATPAAPSLMIWR